MQQQIEFGRFATVLREGNERGEVVDIFAPADV
jgi:hypothetical protein